MSAWSLEERKAYFETFSERSTAFNKQGGATEEAVPDPLSKINAFMDMSEAELDDMTRLMLVISKDDGTLLRELRGAEGSEDPSGRRETMNNIFTTLGSLSNMNKFQRPPGPFGGGVHGAHPSHPGHTCAIHRAPSSSSQPDVSTGKSDTMDRWKINFEFFFECDKVTLLT